MSTRNLQEVLTQLGSTKIKERHDGIVALRKLFERTPSLVQTLDKKGDGKPWLVIFQALFRVVLSEKTACTSTKKKPSDVALRRLGDAAAAVRWLTETTVERLNRKVIKALLAHLLQGIKHQNELLSAVALSYVKTIRCILSFPPHLDHLDEHLWIVLVELGFNVILGDPLKTKLDSDGASERADSIADSDMDNFNDPSGGEDEDEDTDAGAPSVASNPRKRRLVEPSTTVHSPTTTRRSTPQMSQPVTLEQIEFTSLLAILLRSSSTPLLSIDHPYLPSAILNRMRRFLVCYPGDTSLHHDYLVALSAVISHLSLNKCQLLSSFTRNAWDGLVAIWGTKNQSMKESLIIILKALFPFLVVEPEGSGIKPGSGYGDSVADLWHLLNKEAQSRWGIDGLSLDCLRLQVMATDEPESEAFTTSTFRHGWNFDANQASAWAVLELQADCTEKLFLLSESVYATGTSNKPQGKRLKLDNPVMSLLYSAHTEKALNIRVYHLQILLFFIERHWRVLHDSLRENVISSLLQFLSDDALIQSWTFMCLAAIARIDGSIMTISESQRRLQLAATWDPIWTHATRRSNVTAVCRTACHAAYTMLLHSKQLLSSQRVLVEIETLAKDLDVQGPTFPFDSVCAFLILCLRVASQDVRLYRMQLEEKVLSWLMDNWRVGRGHRLRMPLHTVGDMLVLLGNVCGVSRRSNILSEMLLSDCLVVEALTNEQHTAVIRNYLLNARLPPFGSNVTNPSHIANRSGGASVLINRSEICPPSIPEAHSLIQPRGRERRISAFLLKMIEELIAVLDVGDNTPGHASAEEARSSLDLAVTALHFEASLTLNGTRSNRRVIQAACKLIAIVVSFVTHKRLTPEERVLILAGMAPLIWSERPKRDYPDWETMLPPNANSGIRVQIMRALTAGSSSRRDLPALTRCALQRIIFQSADVQDAFTEVLKTLRDTLQVIAGRVSNTNPNAMDIDEKDGFAPVRTQHDQIPSLESRRNITNSGVLNSAVEICMTALAVIPVLQTTSGEPIRDQEVTNFVLECEDDHFICTAQAYLTNVRQRIFVVNATIMDGFLGKFEGVLTQYKHSRSERVQLLAIYFLDSTAWFWLQKSVMSSEVGDKVRSLCSWLSLILKEKKTRSWRIRDYIARFLGAYLAQDPLQTFWTMDDTSGEEPSPDVLLPMLGADEDIRVRFRAAVENARLFEVVQSFGMEPVELYEVIRASLCIQIDEYEHMLTRLLCLGNIMVVSSAARRAPYWHLLETCLHSTIYSRHVEVVLSGVSARLGLTSFTELFESYASQIAYTIRKGELDFLRFPPHLLGYRDRKECAERTFHAFTPTNVLAGKFSASADHGHKLFVNHCKATHRTVPEGIRECFAEIIGYQIVFWVDDIPDAVDPSSTELSDLLRTRTKDMDGEEEFNELLRTTADGIVVAILRTLSDRDLSPDGSIMEALRQTEDRDHAMSTFQKLSRFRLASDFKTHEPNLPAYSSMAILQALRWFGSQVAEADTPATTYHVLHQLFAEIERCPIVNEQIRLINALSIWVASRHHHFRELTLLRTIINGALTILAQPDLIHAAQSILGWAFTLYRLDIDRHTHLPDILMRTSRLAYQYSQDSDDSSIASMGRGLMEWLEQETQKFFHLKKCKSQVLKALSAWPQEPSNELMTAWEEVTSEDVSKSLMDHHISSHKFRLVKRLHSLAIENAYSANQFTKADFWRLKECIPAADQLLYDDIDAFASLLAQHKGLVDSLQSEQSKSRETARMRHIRGIIRKDASTVQAFTHLPHRAIVLSLLGMLDATSALQVNLAYRTLRSIMSVPTLEPPESQAWPSEYRGELGLIRSYPRHPTQRPACDLLPELKTEHIFESIRDFTLWIVQITTMLSDSLSVSDLFYASLVPILVADPSFAEEMLPVLVHTVLIAEYATPNSTHPCCDALSAYFTSILSSGDAHVSCLRSIVEIILHLRNFTPPDTKDALAHDRWLNIDFTLLSRSAIACGAYTTALLFLELTVDNQHNDSPESQVREGILFDIYSHIDEPDGFYGIHTTDLHGLLIKRFHHEKQWDKAFQFHAAGVETRTSCSTDADGVMQALHSFGFNQLAMNALQNTSTSVGDLLNSDTMTYHLGWRTETWDLPDYTEDRNAGAPLYLALRAVYRERDDTTIDRIVREALLEEMSQLRNLEDENMTEIRQVTQNLMCLRQVREWRNDYIQNGLQSKNIDLGEWDHIDSEFDFTDLEAIMATRISLIRSVRQKEQREQIGNLVSPFCQQLINAETKCLVRLSEAARGSNTSQVALNSIIRAQRLQSAPDFDVSYEYANVLWLMKEPKLAAELLKSLLPTFAISTSDNTHRGKHTQLLALLGTWTSEACLEKPSDIAAHYFNPAMQLLSRDDGVPTPAVQRAHATVYHRYAIFAERQYHSIAKSPDALRFRVYVDRKTQEIKGRQREMEGLQAGSGKYNLLNKDQLTAKKVLAEDNRQYQMHNKSRDAFLTQAIDMYSHCLKVSDEFDSDSAIRLCSLWFANFEVAALQPNVDVAIDRVPSRKFVFLAHQLSARISTSESPPQPAHQEILQKLVIRMCREHPFHSLYQVYCLRGERTSSQSSSGRRQSSRHETSSQAERAAAADDIYARLCSDEVSGERAKAVEQVCDASLEWAKFPIKGKVDTKKKGSIPIPENLLIRKLYSLRVPVITVHTPLDPTTQYQNCIWIEHYDSSFVTAGGINLPKIVNCFGSDGKKYKQLFKGEGDDDLRQDAVMEQVFELVNVVLHQDRETRRRDLSVRGYKVIPLAAQAGVLEFVGNTTPLHSWLQTAHQRYRPQDMHVNEINALLKDKARTYGKSDTMTNLFLQVRARFKPVMRHYFTERHKTPMSWFAMRLRYARSVATTSIVGHILGLGDRHTSNILLDNGTGEVVHIDLGIAFEQGKLLPIPERVPFRLTADMVDGFGSSGPQGVFQRCAEETLRVLRNGSEVILTVLEVFKYDPLHSWTASEVKLKRAQKWSDSAQQLTGEAFRYAIGIDMASGTADEAADRALSVVSRKLDKTLSIEYTVNELITEATDVANLAAMFSGWGPYW